MAQLSPLRRLALPAALILVLTAQLVSSLRENSVTVDEFAHLPAGISYWLEGSFATYHHNPPLVRLIAAAPVLLGEVDTRGLEAGENRWRMGMRFQSDNATRYHEIFVRARLAIVALTVLTAGLLFYWTERAADHATACVALGLFCFSPTVLAHGGLVTTDAGFALAFLVACAAFAAALTRPTNSV